MLTYFFLSFSGVLRTLFDTLYDEDIISEDAFNQWETSKDPAEQEGKGVAMKQVVQFFMWLREADDEVDSWVWLNFSHIYFYFETTATPTAIVFLFW